MLRDSHKQAWNNVLVYKLDRFSRNKYEMAIHKRTLRDNGAKVISATENIPDTPEGIILESLLEGMAEYYSAELAQSLVQLRCTLCHQFNHGFPWLFYFELNLRKNKK